MRPQIDLSGFYGSENYYPYTFSSAIYTDGVQYFAEHAGCYWFLDIIFTEYHKLVKREGFLTVTLKVSDSKAIIDVGDGNGIYFKKRHIDYTDCPEGVYQFYFQDGDRPVLMLASEY
jgi:hypothetical protein